jgi:cardiolipin synthase (CMP-forming)
VNLPNAISLGRLLAVPITVWLMLESRWGLALTLFVAAGVSDAIDGWLARTMNARTTLGHYLDPMADKVLLVAVFVTLAIKQAVPTWLVLLIVSRDLLIVGGALLLYVVGQPMKMDPLPISKLNTVAQIVLAGSVLLQLSTDMVPAVLIQALTVAVAVTTLLSGAGYVRELARGSARPPQ